MMDAGHALSMMNPEMRRSAMKLHQPKGSRQAPSSKGENVKYGGIRKKRASSKQKRGAKKGSKKPKDKSRSTESDNDMEEDSDQDTAESKPHENQKVACDMLCNSVISPITWKAITTDPQDPFEYGCRPRPFWDMEDELKDKKMPADDIEDACEAYSHQWNAAHDSSNSDGPVHALANCTLPHVPIMERARAHLAEANRGMKYRDPDIIGIYIYNDWAKHGFTEILQNLVAAYGADFCKTERDLRNMWIHVSTLVWFVACSDFYFGMPSDDWEGEAVLGVVIGRMVLSMFDALEKAGHLKPNTDYQDLGVIASLSVRLYEAYVERGLVDTKDLKWGRMVLQYAQTHDINIDDLFVARSSMKKHREVGKRSWHKGGEDPWNFAAAYVPYFGAYEKEGILGGHAFDITKMDSKKRAGFAYDGKDPLSDIPPYHLYHSNLDWVDRSSYLVGSKVDGL